METQIDLDITRGIVKPEDRGGAVMNATARVDAPVSAVDIPLLPKNQRFRYPAPDKMVEFARLVDERKRAASGENGAEAAALSAKADVGVAAAAAAMSAPQPEEPMV